MNHHYTLEQLRAMPTLATSQTDDLKHDDGKTRVWLSRMTPADGAPYPHEVTIEEIDERGTWQEMRTYRAR